MEFIKNFFKDDEKIIGLCSFKKKTQKTYSIYPDFRNLNMFYATNTKNNFLLS